MLKRKSLRTKKNNDNKTAWNNTNIVLVSQALDLASSSCGNNVNGSVYQTNQTGVFIACQFFL
ncbi:MAG: hypothetical protein KGH88_05440 [Thaumarchaeota archaeon]|nr:hypothetical protein [Nitrososphaerota archaeon]